MIVVALAATPFLGLTGPALGRASLLIVTAVIYGLAITRAGFSELDLKAYFAAIESSTLMGIVMFAVVSSVHGFLLKIVILPGLCTVGLLIYLGSLRILRLLNASDIDFMCNLLPHRLQILAYVMARMCGVKYEASIE